MGHGSLRSGEQLSQDTADLLCCGRERETWLVLQLGFLCQFSKLRASGRGFGSEFLEVLWCSVARLASHSKSNPKEERKVGNDVR